MALQKIIFPSAAVTANNFGAIFAGILSDGAVNGCAVSYSGGVVSVAAGYLVAHGRLIYNNDTLTVAVSGSGVAQVVLVIDASGTGTLTVSARYAATEGELSPLVQEDINNGVDFTYELELACVDVAGGHLLRSLGTAASTRIAAGVIGAVQIANNAVGSAQIANEAVGAAQIAPGSVGPAKLSGVTYASIGLNSDQVRKITISASNPSGGSDGDVWLVV